MLCPHCKKQITTFKIHPLKICCLACGMEYDIVCPNHPGQAIFPSYIIEGMLVGFCPECLDNVLVDVLTGGADEFNTTNTKE